MLLTLGILPSTIAALPDHEIMLKALLTQSICCQKKWGTDVMLIVLPNEPIGLTRFAEAQCLRPSAVTALVQTQH